MEISTFEVCIYCKPVLTRSGPNDWNSLVMKAFWCPNLHPLQRCMGYLPKKADWEEQGKATGHGIVPKVLRTVQGALIIKAEAPTQTR